MGRSPSPPSVDGCFLELMTGWPALVQACKPDVLSCGATVHQGDPCCFVSVFKAPEFCAGPRPAPEGAAPAPSPHLHPRPLGYSSCLCTPPRPWPRICCRSLTAAPLEQRDLEGGQRAGGQLRAPRPTAAEPAGVWVRVWARLSAHVGVSACTCLCLSVCPSASPGSQGRGRPRPRACLSGLPQGPREVSVLENQPRKL